MENAGKTDLGLGARRWQAQGRRRVRDIGRLHMVRAKVSQDVGGFFMSTLQCLLFRCSWCRFLESMRTAAGIGGVKPIEKGVRRI